MDSTEVAVSGEELSRFHLSHALCRVEREGGVTLTQEWVVGTVHLYSQSCDATREVT